MDAALKLREPAGGPLENILQLPGLGALAATVNLNGLRTAERLELSVDAGPFHGRAQGVMNLADLSADLDFSVDSPAVAPRSDLSWKRASVHGRWHGSIKEPRADAHVEVDELRLPAGTQLASLNADLNAEAGSATLHAVIAGLRIPGPSRSCCKILLSPSTHRCGSRRRRGPWNYRRPTVCFPCTRPR